MGETKRWTRRDFLQVAGGGIAAAVAATARAAAAPAPRCNVLFLQTDQHNAHVLGCMGNPLVQTSNLDRLAAEGARFTNALCVTPFCSPSRASWVTGLWPHSHGIMQNVDGKARGLTDDVWLMPNVFHDYGYRTAHFGKWHLGDRAELRCYRGQSEAGRHQEYNQWRKRVYPNSRIKDESRPGETLVGQVYMREPVTSFHERWHKETRRSPQDLSIIGRSALPFEYQWETWLTQQCIDYINQNRDKPFFVTLSFSPPHAFWVAPDPYYSMYDPREMPIPKSWPDMQKAYAPSQPVRMADGLGEAGIREYLRCYYAQVTMVDALFGRVLDKLRELKLLDNTLVLFTSDHGDMQGAHHAMGKSLPAAYEEIMRVPLLVRHPASIKPGTVVSATTESVDVPSTFLDYAGLPAPSTLQGRSVCPWLDGALKSDYRPGFCERGAGKNSMRTIRTGDWKYTLFRYPRGGVRRELFHLAADPDELANLADAPAQRAIMRDLDRQLQVHAQRTSDTETLRAWPELT